MFSYTRGSDFGTMIARTAFTVDPMLVLTGCTPTKPPSNAYPPLFETLRASTTYFELRMCSESTLPLRETPRFENSKMKTLSQPRTCTCCAYNHRLTHSDRDEAIGSATRRRHFGLPAKPLACGCSRIRAGHILVPYGSPLIRCLF